VPGNIFETSFTVPDLIVASHSIRHEVGMQVTFTMWR